jgi:membrane protein DedA with SNARE-associated domain
MSLDALAAWVLNPGLPPPVIYGLLFVGCVLESFFPPWPADLVALYAGFLAGRGLLDATGVFVVAIGGTQVGVMAAFWLARRWGRALLGGRLGHHLPVARLARLEAWFARYGAPAIAISRFFPGVRALVTPAAALAGFSPWKVGLYSGLSVLVWNVAVVGLGFFAGNHLDFARQLLVRYNVVAGALVAVAVAGAAAWLVHRRRAAATR